MWRNVALIVGLTVVLVGCGSSAQKRAGESCSASSECASGLLCDLAQKPAVCSDKGSLDAFVAPPDGSNTPVDARAVDARTIDAPQDATPDAPPDTM